MSKLNKRLLLIIVCLLLSSHCLTFASTPKNNETSVIKAEIDRTGSLNLPENYTSEQVEAILARLSDDQVRRLLIKELQKSAPDLKTDTDFIKQMAYVASLAQGRMMEMLEDEEFGQNFIKQIKSQGIRDISNSVMTIRVKFTAQPGTQFLIRRLAYKQITEALAKAGIHYAHRKVIVDVGQPEPPKDQSSDVPSEETQGNSKSSDMDLNQTLKAGAAAALATIIDEEKKEEQKQKK